MPSIWITTDQERALANGERIVIVPPLAPRYIVLFANGNTFEGRSRSRIETGTLVSHSNLVADRAGWKLIAKGPHQMAVGEYQSSIGGPALAVRAGD